MSSLSLGFPELSIHECDALVCGRQPFISKDNGNTLVGQDTGPV